MVLNPNVFCTFCGVVLLHHPDGLIHSLPWYTEAQAVFADRSDPGRIKLSGIGNLDGRNVLFAPMDSALNYTDPVPLRHVRLLHHDDCWGFGFHHACWRLLMAKLGPEWDESEVAISVFRLFYCMPCSNYSSLDFGHDYGGAAQEQITYGSPRVYPLTYFWADPWAVSLDELETIASPLQKFHHDWRDVQTRSGSLGRLPAELLYHVISYLPYSQVKNLRLTCRELALMTSHDVLPPSFWKSRFLPGFDGDFLLADMRETRDWARLFKGIELSLLSHDPSLNNRKRICDLLEPIASLVKWMEISRDDMLETFSESSDLLEKGSWFSGELSDCSGGPISDGCRAMHVHQANLDLENIRKIGVSTVPFGSDTFISGLCLFKGQETERLGWCAAPYQHIHTPTGSIIESCEVAFSRCGLVGLRCNFSDNTSSPWIGRTLGDGIARGIMTIPKDSAAPHLVVGADVYKIVHLGFPDLPREHANPGELSVRSHLWTPDIPRHEGLVVTSLQPVEMEQTFDPLINIDFGGPGGIQLASLTRIVAHMVTSSYSIVGMDFHYSDDSVKLFGKPGTSEISFCIDGPGGERISEVDVVLGYVMDGMGGLEMSTTYGRKVHFCTRLSRPSNTTNRRIKQELPPGYLPTGLVAKTQPPPQNSFLSLGVYGQRIGGPFNIPDGYLQGLIYPDTFDDNKAICDFQTYAPLWGVRQITSFVGINDKRSRSPCNITGLKLDYSAGQPPAAVGQLIQQHETIELFRDEQTTAMKVWMVNDAQSQKDPKSPIRQGQIMAIEMQTSSGRYLTFRPCGAHTQLDGFTMHQFERQGRDQIMGICWVFNACYDSVQAVRVSENTAPFAPLPDYHREVAPANLACSQSTVGPPIATARVHPF